MKTSGSLRDWPIDIVETGLILDSVILSNKDLTKKEIIGYLPLSCSPKHSLSSPIPGNTRSSD